MLIMFDGFEGHCCESNRTQLMLIIPVYLCNTFSSILASWIRIRKIMWINESKPKSEKFKKDRFKNFPDL